MTVRSTVRLAVLCAIELFNAIPFLKAYETSESRKITVLLRSDQMLPVLLLSPPYRIVVWSKVALAPSCR